MMEVTWTRVLVVDVGRNEILAVSAVRHQSILGVLGRGVRML